MNIECQHFNQDTIVFLSGFILPAHPSVRVDNGCACMMHDHQRRRGEYAELKSAHCDRWSGPMNSVISHYSLSSSSVAQYFVTPGVYRRSVCSLLFEHWPGSYILQGPVTTVITPRLHFRSICHWSASGWPWHQLTSEPARSFCDRSNHYNHFVFRILQK